MSMPEALIPRSQEEPFMHSNTKVLKKIEGCEEFTIEEALEENEYFQPEVWKATRFITTQEGVLPVGSVKFKVHKYPSDIDIFERVVKCCTINDVRLSLAFNIQQIIRKVMENKNILFGDFKAGYDQRYDIYLGEEYMGEIVDYNQDIARLEFLNLKHQGLITNKEYNKFRELLQKNMTIGQFEKLKNYLNEFRVLRWNPEEILRGYKEVLGKKRIYLFDALVSRTVVKMDLWIPIPYENICDYCLDEFRNEWDFDRPQRYVEVTNWILVQLKDIEGQIQTLSQELPDYARSLRLDVWHYLQEENYLKATKRFWSYLLFVRKMLLHPQEPPKDVMFLERSRQHNQRLIAKNYTLCQVEELIKDIAPLFSSYIALLYAVKGDLEVISDIIKSDLVEVDKNYPLQTIDGMQIILRCTVPECLYDPVIKINISKELEQLKTNITPETIDEVVSYIQNFINEKTKKYLQIKDINIGKILFPYA